MQGLQTVWNLPKEGYSWATAGYMGAIASGRTTCGLLIGSSIAIGLKCGQGKEGIPEVNETERDKAISSVNYIYREFLKEFGDSECKNLIKCDFSNPDDYNRYVQNKVWKETCDVFLSFIMRKCVEMSNAGKL